MSIANNGSIEAFLTLNATGFNEGLDSSLTAVEKFKANFSKNITPLSKDLEALKSALRLLQSTLEGSSRAINQFSVNARSLSQFNTYASAVNKLANALKILSSDTINAEMGMNVINNMFKYFQGTLNGVEVKISGVRASMENLTSTESKEATVTENVAVATQQYERALELALPPTRELITGTTRLAEVYNYLQKEETETKIKTDEATNSMNRQSTASKGLSKSLSSLRMMGTMVASMLVYNFAHNLITATRETVNAKSEMNGYFQMLGYTSGEVDHFNKKLDEMIQKFPRINKYSLGETISSIGVEFELTTKEMEKAMPVVSMITSEYLRAGRNVNEASLAVKDILQGEFQRLSRETGVKGDQLKEAGWSGDKKDVMGLLEALDKVGKARNWDVFVAKANSLNDAIIILQNRFGEWSADMVEKIQPAILGVFNALIQISSTFANHLNGIIDFISGNEIAQGIGWTLVATHIISVVGALVNLRTGANLTQIAQMGLRRSILATVLGLEAEQVATHGVIDTILLRNESITAETLSNYGRLNSITAVITGLEAEEVATIGKTKALAGAVLGVDMATLKEYGLTVALLENTTQMEANAIASMGLAGKIALLGASFIAPLAIVSGFALALGALAIEMNNSAQQMEKFNKLVNDNDKIMNDAYKTQRKYLDRQKSQQKQLSKLTKGTDEYRRKQAELRDTNRLLALAEDDVLEKSKAVTLARNSKEYYDTTKEEKALRLQGQLADAYIKSGIDSTVANEMANESYLEAENGANQLYLTLQGIQSLNDKHLKGTTDLLDAFADSDIDDDTAKKHIKQINTYQNMIVKGYEKGMTDESFFGRLDGWLTHYEGQIGKWYETVTSYLDAGKWSQAFENIWKGIAHGFADLPIVKDFWGWIFKQLNVNKYKGQGWDAFGNIFNDFSKWFTDSLFHLDTENDVIGKFIEDIVKTSTENIDHSVEQLNNAFIKPITEWWNNFTSDPLGTLGIDLSGFDIWSIFGFDTVSASDGSSDHPSFMEDLSNIIGVDIQTWVNNFNNDPLGTLGISIPTLDLGQIFNISGTIESFSAGLSSMISRVSSTVSIVTGYFSNLKTNIQTHLTNIVTNVTNGFNSVKNNAVSKITAMKDSVKGVIDKMVGAWNTMKDSILNASKKIQDGVKAKFDSVKDTIGGFYHKLTNPSEWFSGGGHESYSRTPRPATARRVVKSTGLHGAGSPNPYGSTSRQISLNELVARLGGDKRVDLNSFLSLFANSGFGGWDFSKKHKDTIYGKAKTWRADSPSWNGVTLGNGYPMDRFWYGSAKGFTWNEFMATAQAIFSAIPYKFYMDSDWKGSWVGALLSGAVNCSDGADALLALASLFGFSGEKVHTTLKDGVGHFFTIINGHKMDTTAFQQHGSWSPLGGAGVPTRSYVRPRSDNNSNQATVNITVDMSNSNIYGVDDLDNRIENGLDKGLQKYFNDPYTVNII